MYTHMHENYNSMAKTTRNIVLYDYNIMHNNLYHMINIILLKALCLFRVNTLVYATSYKEITHCLA